MDQIKTMAVDLKIGYDTLILKGRVITVSVPIKNTHAKLHLEFVKHHNDRNS